MCNRASAQHRVLVKSRLSEDIFGQQDTLIAAKHLIGISGIRVSEAVQPVTYWHFLLDRHDVVYANGAPAETLLIGPEALKSLHEDQRREIGKIVPELKLEDVSAISARTAARGQKMRAFLKRFVTSGATLYSE